MVSFELKKKYAVTYKTNYGLTRIYQTDSKFRFHLVRLVAKILGRQENILMEKENERI
nr:MAG TPA: hypothetical protein [Caudoviricetes sp.]